MVNSAEMPSLDPQRENDGVLPSDEQNIGELRQDYQEIRDFLNLAGENSEASLDEFLGLENTDLFEKIKNVNLYIEHLNSFAATISGDEEFTSSLGRTDSSQLGDDIKIACARQLADALRAIVEVLSDGDASRELICATFAHPIRIGRTGMTPEHAIWYLFNYRVLDDLKESRKSSAIENILAYEENKKIWESVDIEEAKTNPILAKACETAGIDLNEVTQGHNLIRLFEVKKFIYNYRIAPEAFASGHIDKSLQNLYDSPEFILREYEGKTINTVQGLTHAWWAIKFLEQISQRDGFKTPHLTTMLDIGGGEGRSGIPFTYAGIDVNAYDISPRMVHDSRKRISQDRESGELLEAARSAGLPVKSSDQFGFYNQVIGNFFDFDYRKYQSEFPGSPRPQVATIMWHSLGFAGSPEGIQKVLKNAYDILDSGGLLLVEMPDRDFGAYKVALDGFHEAHPDYPIGAMIDAPSKQEGQSSEENLQTSTPRYFPSNFELVDIAEQAGFTRSYGGEYFVYHNLSDGRQIPVIKEKLSCFIKV
ncbi:MAG: class I SAM-dependent methyltransferase [bacterium]|nr:class I SAM-dependent methyltransferase [Patescibacteria group bacterium]